MMGIRLLVCTGLCWSSAALAVDPAAYELKGAATLRQGTRGKASVSVIVTAKPGWHINEKAPLSLAVLPPAGVVVRKKTLVRADLTVDTPQEARFDVPVSCKTPGARSITVEARFVICKAELCTPQSDQLTIALDTGGSKTIAAGGPPGR